MFDAIDIGVLDDEARHEALAGLSARCGELLPLSIWSLLMELAAGSVVEREAAWRIADANRPKPRCYIALEGPKGCGKNTLLDGLRQRMDARGLKAAWVDMTAPAGPNPFDALRSRQAGTAGHDVARELDYAARSWSHARSVAWNDEPLVIGSRSILTGFATRLHMGPGEAQRVMRTRLLEPASPIPTHVFVLDGSPEELAARTRSRGRLDSRDHETAAAIAQHRASYHRLMSSSRDFGMREVRFTRLNAEQRPDEVLEQAWRAIEPIALRALDREYSLLNL